MNVLKKAKKSGILAIYKPLELIFRSCLISDDCEKTNFVPVHTKRDKQIYQSISLLPICENFLNDYFSRFSVNMN